MCMRNFSFYFCHYFFHFILRICTAVQSYIELCLALQDFAIQTGENTDAHNDVDPNMTMDIYCGPLLEEPLPLKGVKSTQGETNTPQKNKHQLDPLILTPSANRWELLQVSLSEEEDMPPPGREVGCHCSVSGKGGRPGNLR